MAEAVSDGRLATVFLEKNMSGDQAVAAIASACANCMVPPVDWGKRLCFLMANNCVLSSLAQQPAWISDILALAGYGRL